MIDWRDILIGGAGGSFVRLALLRPKNFWDWIIPGLSGCLIAFFLTDPLMGWLKFDSIATTRFDGSVAFVLGLTGLIIAERIMMFARVVRFTFLGSEFPTITTDSKEDKK